MDNPPFDELTPPIDIPEDDPFDDGSIADTKWPVVVGTISIVYGSLGLLCGVVTALWTMFMESIFSAADFDVQAPAQIKIIGVLGAVLGSGLGLLMLLGAIALVRRRRRGVGLLKAWAMVRMMWLVVALGLGLWIMPANIRFQLDIQAAQVKRFEADGNAVPAALKRTEESLWKTTVIMTAVSTLVIAVYPSFMILYLSRRKIVEETSRWH